MLSIEQLRQQIERTDAAIIEKLAERQELSRQIGRIKLKEGNEIVDPPQESKLFEFYQQLCDKYQLPQSYVKRLFNIIIFNSRMVQKS